MRFATLALCAAIFTTVSAQEVSVCDRGLPTANLNNAAGPSRSNVAWSFGPTWITGDDCTIGVAGETWVVTKLTGWSVQGAQGGLELGSRFESVSLYLGLTGSPLQLLSTGNLALNSSINSNSSIVHSRVNYSNGQGYQAPSSAFLQLWQTDFTNLAFVVPGGAKLQFAADGILQDGVSYNWFNHASNASLSGNVQQNADNLYLGWDRTDLATAYTCDSGDNTTCGGWDKSSDLNVKIYAVKLVDGMATGGGWFVPEPNAVGLTLDGSKATFGFVVRSKNAVGTGNLEFHYNADGINLNSTSLDWVQVAAGQAMFEGTGSINAAGSYRFRVRAVDSASDRFEIRIWTTGGGFDSPLYRAEGNLGGGQVVVHKK